MLFGRAPRRLLHQAGIRWIAFEGDDKSYNTLYDRLELLSPNLLPNSMMVEKCLLTALPTSVVPRFAAAIFP
ncbi:MAG: hypothetical protein OXE78_04555 [Gammaproteobacteria bacterium]|nr:hypothetical protein [Gammaproteobacteria bacterium]MCY4356306.1 hypothetical protein [Gammaproteobacteria bacterium]